MTRRYCVRCALITRTWRLQTDSVVRMRPNWVGVTRRVYAVLRSKSLNSWYNSTRRVSTCSHAVTSVSHRRRRHYQWRRQRGEGGKLPPLWVDVQKLCNTCVLSLSWNFFVSHDKCNAVNVSASGRLRTLDSYRPIPQFPAPCYKILAAPLATIYSASAAAIGDSNWWAPSTHLL